MKKTELTNLEFWFLMITICIISLTFIFFLLLSGGRFRNDEPLLKGYYKIHNSR